MKKFVISLLVAWLAVLACRVDSGPTPKIADVGPKTSIQNSLIQPMKSDANNLTASECDPCE